MEFSNLTDTLTAFISVFQSGYSRLQPSVNSLLKVLLGIEIVLAGLYWALGGGDRIVGVLKKLLFLCCWIWIVQNFTYLASSFVDSLVQAGSLAGGSSSGKSLLLDPSKIAGYGLAPHMMCSTVGATPFRLNLNVGDVGHTLVIGPTGAGKSVLLNMLALQWLKYPSAQVVIFDKDRSARGATLAVGGRYYEPGNDDCPVAFQPLAPIHRKPAFIWAATFIEHLLEAQSVDVTSEDKKEIVLALKSLATDKAENRTLTIFRELCQSLKIKEALGPYILGGTFGQLFDASCDTFHDGKWIMIEMGHVMQMGQAVILPALDYLFYRVEQRFYGAPTLLILDEAWLFLSHPVFMRRLQNWLKTLRKKNVYVVFATQEVADATDSPIMPTILSACHTKIFLPDEEALTPAMARAYRDFGLTDTEIQIVACAQKKRDYYYRSPKGRRLFTLDLGPVALTFAGMSSPADQRFLDELMRTQRPEDIPSSMLRYRGVHTPTNSKKEVTPNA